MFKRLFGRQDDLFDPHMPSVDEPQNITEIFANARATARGEMPPPDSTSEHSVVIVTPGRMLMMAPCPLPGSMPQKNVDGIEKMMPSTTKRNVVAIAYNQLDALMADKAKTIPFLGMLTGFAYIGHAVWVFEGHESALAEGCREADILLVDGSMVPFLSTNWIEVVSSAMRRPEIYVHDRKSFTLRPVHSATP